MHDTKSKSWILLLDGNPTTADASRAALDRAGFGTVTLGSASAALTYPRLGDFACILMDLAIAPSAEAGVDTTPVGLELIKALRASPASPSVVVLAGQASISSAIAAVRAGAFDYLVRPISMSRMIAAVRAALKDQPVRSARSLPAAASGPVGDDHPFLGQCETMRGVFKTLAAVARSKASLFITGESGTGKELAAEAVHRQSARATSPFVAINCAAIPRDLLESTIFGHSRGAFTGATDNVEGAAERAEGGTLFLDELAEMDRCLQVKLVRFIQSGGYYRVGDPRPRQANVRFVAATNKDPAAAIASGCLREDLFYRLCVVRVVMPPLRERGSDVTLLAQQFLHYYARLEERNFKSIDADVQLSLLRHPWPGNVRQLQNLIHEAVVLNDGPVLTFDMLPAQWCAEAAAAHARSGSMERAGMLRFKELAKLETTESLHIDPLSEAEQNYINWAIRCCGGNLQAASRKLGISPSTIYRKREIWSRERTDRQYSLS